MRKWLCISALSVLIALGTWGVFYSLIDPVITWSKAASWESTVVQIDKTELERVKAGSSPSLYLTIQYSYEWNGVRYQNDSLDIYPNSLGRSIKKKQSLFAQYKDQKTTEAFVNPADPQSSVLQRDFHANDFLNALFKQVLVLYFYLGLGWMFMALAFSESESESEGEGKGEIESENEKQERVSETTARYESSAWKFVAYFAGMFSLISIRIIASTVSSVRAGDLGVLFFLVFPCAALALWWAVWYCWTRRFDLKTATAARTANSVS